MEQCSINESNIKAKAWRSKILKFSCNNSGQTDETGYQCTDNDENNNISHNQQW